MKPFARHTGVAAALRRHNVDTDVIITMESLLSHPRGSLGPFALEGLRRTPSGGLDPSFVLNDGRMANASILVCGRNFGSGSSREGAVYALMDLGVRVVIAEGFGDIFRSNATKNGLLALPLAPGVVLELMDRADAAAGAAQLTVDLEAQTIEGLGGAAVRFELDPAQRTALLAGVDDIARTDALAAEVAGFREGDRRRRPWAYEVPGLGTRG